MIFLAITEIVSQLHANRLTTVPETIGNLVNLSELYVSICDRFAKINADLSQINDNKLTTLPESIGNLMNVTALYVGTSDYLCTN